MKKLHTLILFLLIALLASFLRLYDISNNPPGLYIDEVSIGYNAHTILTKGVDEYGVPYPFAFKTFGDYKMPLYIYTTAMSEFVFGKNEFAVRAPSALAGIFTVLGIYFLMKYILLLKPFVASAKIKKYLPLLSMFTLAISPWHIQFSRGGFEVNMALGLYLFAILSVILFLYKKNSWYLILSAVFFTLTLYTYFVYRVVTPLSVVIILILLWKFKLASWKRLGLFFITFTLLSLPSIFYSLTTSGMTRFSQTSAFNGEAWYSYPFIYMKNYFSYFSLSFLFASGDGFGRHAMPWFGLLPKWELPFILVGLVYLLKTKKSLLKYVVLALIFIAPTAAAFAVPSPHAIRSFIMVIPLSILLSVGLIIALTHKKKLFRFGSIVILLIACIETIFIIHHYTIHYPRINQPDWGAGYKEMVAAASKEKNAIFIIDTPLNFAPIYFSYYNDSLIRYYGENTPKIGDIPKNKRVIIIRKLGTSSTDKLIKNIEIPHDVDHNIFVQFWEVKR